MAVYVVVDPATGSLVEGARHLDLWCIGRGRDVGYLGRQKIPRFRGRIPRWSSGSRTIAYVPNTASIRDPVTTRCDPGCFEGGGPLKEVERWQGWEAEVARSFPAPGVYEFADEELGICQIGSGPPSRVRSRIRATHSSRFDRPDTIWWLYDALRQGRRPVLRSLEVADGEKLRAAEERWRETRRRAGWQVSSDT